VTSNSCPHRSARALKGLLFDRLFEGSREEPTGVSRPSDASFRATTRFALGAAFAFFVFARAIAAPLAVEVENASTPTLCAETDNVYLKFVSAQVRQFSIEATHPAYIGTIVADDTAPDFRRCDMANSAGNNPDGAAGAAIAARRVTLYETSELQLVGHAIPTFWRLNSVPVRVGTRIEQGLHLLQVFVRFGERSEEVLVLYPTDGYWRARPLPPPHLQGSAYGSSFLIGPVEATARPYVDIRDIAFDPTTRTFTLAFARGGNATLHLDAVDREHIKLDVKFDRPIDAALPFAALRSMFVTETNADVAQVAWLAPGAPAFATSPILDLKTISATELWVGRRLPSRHNTSAPDLTFTAFHNGE
jgi:hypothetical protein